MDSMTGFHLTPLRRPTARYPNGLDFNLLENIVRKLGRRPGACHGAPARQSERRRPTMAPSRSSLARGPRKLRPRGAPGGAAPPIARGWRARGGPHHPAPERRADCPIARAVHKGASQAPWRLPALHSRRGTEKGTPASPAPSKNRAGGALAKVQTSIGMAATRVPYFARTCPTKGTWLSQPVGLGPD